MDNLLLFIFVANTQTGGGNLPCTGSKPQSVTVPHHPAHQASKGFCVQEEE